MGKNTSPMQYLMIKLIRAYQIVLSPVMGHSCRFYPSCSSYAIEAISQHGAGKGLLLTLYRLGRCQPLCQGGFDPVPETCCALKGKPKASRRRPASSEPTH